MTGVQTCALPISDCATVASGWEASWACSLSGSTPTNLQVSAPGCSNNNYSVTLTWNNSGTGWWIDISTDPAFGAYSNKAVDGLTTTDAPAGFSGGLVLQPDTTYYWRIWNGTVQTYGSSFVVATCPDLTPPTTTISNPNTWESGNFTTTFTDTDAGGSGLDLSFYQPLDYNGTEWRANDGNGFFNDNFDLAIHSDWTQATGTWAISSGSLNQSDEAEGNSNIYASLAQSNTEIYLYHWQANMQSGTSSNRRSGLHFFSDDASLPNRGNSYFVYFRVDQNKCQIYEVVNDSWSMMTDDVVTVDPDTWYDYKVIFNPTTGEIKAYQNDVLVSSWTDPSPLTSGNYISLRTGNVDVLYNDFKVYRARTGSETISVGSASTNDIRYQNPNPSTPSCRIKSIVKDSAENWSTLETLNVNIDWTAPADVTVSDGLGADIDAVCTLTELSANWSSSSDQHSDIVRYLYSIGTSPGATDVVIWTDNALDTNITRSGLSLTQGQTYYFTVRTENGAGLFSNDISSDGLTANTNPVISITADTTALTLPDSTINFTDNTAGAAAWDWVFSGATPSTSSVQAPTVYYNTAGSYDVTLTVTDSNGCVTSATYTSFIVVSDPPPAPPIANFTNDVTSGCEPLTVNFSDASANFPTGWLWSFPGGDITTSTDQYPTVVYSTPGTYDVTLLASNSWGNDTMLLPGYITIYPIPVVSLTSDQLICEGNTATLIASGGDSYLWNTGQTDDTITIAPLTTTAYSVTASANGCVSEPDTVIVSVTTQPVVSLTPDQTICLGDSVNLIANGGNSYIWDSGDTSATIKVSPVNSTAYTVTAFVNACTSEPASVIVTVITPPVISLTPDQSVCEGVPVVLTASGGDSYLWGTSDTTSSITVSPSSNATYTVAVSINECQEPAYDSVDISVIPLPFADFSINDTLGFLPDAEIIFTNNSSNADSYSWNFGDGAASTDINPWHEYTDTGIFTVILIAISNQCPNDTLVQENIITVDFYTWKNTIKKDHNSIIIYPNPFSNISTISFTGSATEPYDFTLTDIYGKTVKRINNIEGNKMILKRESLPQGMYFYQLSNDKGIQFKGRVIIR